MAEITILVPRATKAPGHNVWPAKATISILHRKIGASEDTPSDLLGKITEESLRQLLHDIVHYFSEKNNAKPPSS